MQITAQRQDRHGGNQIQRGQPMCVGKAASVRQIQNQNRRQKPGRFHQLQRSAVGLHITTTGAFERPFHRRAQIISRIGDALHPGWCRVVGQRQPRQILIIDPRLKRLGPPRGHCQKRDHHPKPEDQSAAAHSTFQQPEPAQIAPPFRTTGTPMRRSARARANCSVMSGPKLM